MTLDPGYKIIVTSQAPSSRLWRTWARVRVSADRHLSVRVLSEAGFREFNRGRMNDFSLYHRSDAYYMSEFGKDHIFNFRPEHGERWYLVIVNNGDEFASVFYEVT
jgi:hypothetical protein